MCLTTLLRDLGFLTFSAGVTPFTPFIFSLTRTDFSIEPLKMHPTKKGTFTWKIHFKFCLRLNKFHKSSFSRAYTAPISKLTLFKIRLLAVHWNVDKQSNIKTKFNLFLDAIGLDHHSFNWRDKLSEWNIQHLQPKYNNRKFVARNRLDPYHYIWRLFLCNVCWG